MDFWKQSSCKMPYFDILEKFASFIESFDSKQSTFQKSQIFRYENRTKYGIVLLYEKIKKLRNRRLSN